MEEGRNQLEKLKELVTSTPAEEINLVTPRSTSSWRMENLLSTDRRSESSQGMESDDPTSLLRVILGEYRDLLEHVPSGMAVAPSFRNLLEWHGSLHLKDGFYRGAVFKFVMHIPVDYPVSPPGVYFLNHVFHPLVDKQSGKLDISPAFPTWKPGRDYLVLVLCYLKKIFFKRELNSFQTTMTRESFTARCEDCVEESLRLVYVSHPNSPIPFAPWRRGKSVTSLMSGIPDNGTSAIFDAIQSAASQLPPHIPLHERADMLSDWLTTELIPSILAGDNQDN